MSVQSLAAAGSNQGDAGAITGGIVAVTAADGTKGVRLPTAAAETQVFVYNTGGAGGTNALKVYPHSGGDINNGTTDASVNIAGKAAAHFVALNTTNWAQLS